ncbi:hypothetical protein AC1031_014333 [Aphanomyces cochlioides]|nr:hypothetical protein AC1031_014333 [Aphanomyces cochlioides]
MEQELISKFARKAASTAMDSTHLIWANPILRQVIMGYYDPTSALSCLRGKPELLQVIVTKVIQAWAAHVNTTTRGFMRLNPDYSVDQSIIPGHVPLYVTFPKPWRLDQNITFHVNMMPFVMGDKNSLPRSCQRYVRMIQEWFKTSSSDEIGKVGYLAIHEGIVQGGTSQRRSGLHIEAGGATSSQTRMPNILWGSGEYEEHRIYGGIYMASTVEDSCCKYDAVIDNPQDVVGHLGDIEHLRDVLDKSYCANLCPANELVWITDCTPHESLPLKTTQYRQFFRLVTSQVSHWYADHSTPNPLGIQPTAEIIYGNKFHPHEDAKAWSPRLYDGSMLS